MALFYIAVKEGLAEVVSLKLTLGIKPKLPKYEFSGPYHSKTTAEKLIPCGVRYKGKLIKSKKVYVNVS